jgi:Rieske Fe-S protein
MTVNENEPGVSQQSTVGRRGLLQGVALTGVGLALAGCGGAEAPTPETSGNPSPEDTGQGSPSQSSAGAAALAATADIPVDGGVVNTEEEVVVTQPEDGTFKAFTAVCTHQGCIVDTVADGVISCPCHGSQYSVADGSVVGGPAPAALAEIDINVQDGQVVRA